MKQTKHSRMTGDELARTTRAFDRPGGEPAFLPAPAAEQRRHDALIRKIKRRRGRPRVGEGAMRVQITMERSLLDKADRFARAQGLSRSELISRCLTPMLAKRSA